MKNQLNTYNGFIYLVCIFRIKFNLPYEIINLLLFKYRILQHPIVRLLLKEVQPITRILNHPNELKLYCPHINFDIGNLDRENDYEYDYENAYEHDYEHDNEFINEFNNQNTQIDNNVNKNLINYPIYFKSGKLVRFESLEYQTSINSNLDSNILYISILQRSIDSLDEYDNGGNRKQYNLKTHIYTLKKSKTELSFGKLFIDLVYDLPDSYKIINQMWNIGHYSRKRLEYIRCKNNNDCWSNLISNLRIIISGGYITNYNFLNKRLIDYINNSDYFSFTEYEKLFFEEYHKNPNQFFCKFCNCPLKSNYSKNYNLQVYKEYNQILDSS